MRRRRTMNQAATIATLLSIVLSVIAFSTNDILYISWEEDNVSSNNDNKQR